MAADENAFRPDWCIAPSATLREWMEENVAGSLRVLVACCGPERRKQAAALIQAVLDREPLTDECAEVLGYCTMRERFPTVTRLVPGLVEEPGDA